MPKFLPFIVRYSLLFFFCAVSQAATAQTFSNTFKLVMFETRACYYCQVFNKTILPKYEQHPLSFQVPIKRVNMDHEGLGGYKLKQKVLGTPTIVMLNRGKEVERITGFLPEKKFYRAVRYMLRKAKRAERRYQQMMVWKTDIQKNKR